MRIAIVGSRDYPRLDLVRGLVTLSVYSEVPPTIISGGARGVDRTAAEAAREVGLQVVEHRPDPSERNKAKALMARNTTIARECDQMWAFWDGASSGTLDAMKKAYQRGKRVFVVDKEGNMSPFNGV